MILLPHQSVQEWIGHGCHAAHVLVAIGNLTCMANIPMDGQVPRNAGVI